MKKELKIFIISAVLFLIYTAVVSLLDVQGIGPLESKVGFASVNLFVSNLLPFNGFFYKVSQILGLLALLLFGYAVATGFFQLVGGMSFKAVEFKIWMLGIFYFLIFVLYLLFNNVIIINYRPVLSEGILEPSYPSSHTMLAICVYAASGICFFKEKKWIRYLCMIMAFLTVLTRFLSGVHWITDIVGSVFISVTLINMLKWLLSLGNKNKK